MLHRRFGIPVWAGFVLGSLVGVNSAEGAGGPPASDAAVEVNEAAVPIAEINEPEDEPDVKLKFRPNSVSLNRSISFDEHGNARHRSENLSINLMCSYRADQPPLGYRGLTLESATTSAGEALDVTEVNQRNQGRHGGMNHHGNQRQAEFQVYFNLPTPKRFATTIREIRGTMTLLLSEGEPRAIRLDPLSKYVDRRFRIADMEDLTMSLTKIDPAENEAGRLEFTHPRRAQPLIQQVRFFGRGGVDLEMRRRGSMSSNDRVTLRYALPPLEQTAMVIELFRGTSEVELPFVIHDVPLPVPEREQDPVDLAVRTVPLAEAKKPGVGDPGAGNVEVILID
jgi:hypothetical protein